MSTKVYRAWKLRRSKDLWPLVRDVRQRGEKNVQKELRKLYETAMNGVDTASQPYLDKLKWLDGDEWRARHSIAHTFINEAYRSQLGRSDRNAFNFDVSVVIREYQGGLYLIPHCDMTMGHVLDFLDKHPMLRDFSYWNNTDRREGVSERQWRERGKIWDALDANGWKDNLIIDICSWPQFYMLDPWRDILVEYSRAEKKAAKT